MAAVQTESSISYWQSLDPETPMDPKSTLSREYPKNEKVILGVVEYSGRHYLSIVGLILTLPKCCVFY